MKSVSVTMLLFITVILAVDHAFAHIAEKMPDPYKTEFTEPHKMVEIYLKAVDRGELIVFDLTLNRSMITPVQVEYVYKLNKLIPAIKVFSKINQPLSVPEVSDCELRGVTATLNTRGHIIKIEAHVWPN